MPEELDSTRTNSEGCERTDEDSVAEHGRRWIAEVCLAAFWIVVGVLMVVQLGHIKLLTSVKDPLGPRIVPLVVGIVLMVLGAAIGISAVWGHRGSAATGRSSSVDESEEGVMGETLEVRQASTRRGLFFIALSLGYLVLIPYAGYIAATFVAALVMMLALRSREKVIVMVAWSAVLAFGTFWIFTQLLSVQLPAGKLF